MGRVNLEPKKPDAPAVYTNNGSEENSERAKNPTLAIT